VDACCLIALRVRIADWGSGGRYGWHGRRLQHDGGRGHHGGGGGHEGGYSGYSGHGHHGGDGGGGHDGGYSGYGGHEGGGGGGGRKGGGRRGGRPQSTRGKLREIQLAYSAIAQAAYETLAYAYPHQEGTLSAALNTYFASFFGVQEGKDWGSRVAQALIAWREGDGWDAGPVFTPFPHKQFKRWEHQPDPHNMAQPQYAVHWGNVQPYGFHSGMEGKVMSMPNPLHQSYTVRPALTFALACRTTYSSISLCSVWCRRRHCSHASLSAAWCICTMCCAIQRRAIGYASQPMLVACPSSSRAPAHTSCFS
jgi:hypothetical protein